jgi:hypothetical protein
MMDASELNNITDHFDESKTIYHGSDYKYGVFKKVLVKLYPSFSDYKIKKIFDNLIILDVIQQIPINKSYRYKYNKKKFREFGNAYSVTDDGRYTLHFE